MSGGASVLIVVNLMLVAAIPALAAQQELGLLPAWRFWTRRLDSALLVLMRRM
jgi:hypothetical protein